MKKYNFASMTVLIVEDSGDMQKLLLQILRGFGVGNIIQVTDGAEAYSALQAHAIDIAIVDWLMEPMSGYDFVKKLRTDPSSPNRHLPVLMVTAHPEMWRVVAARDSGVNEVMVKPVSPDGLLKRLIYMVEKPRPFVESEIYFGPDRRRKSDLDYDGANRREGLSETEADQIDAMVGDDGNISSDAISALFGN